MLVKIILPSCYSNAFSFFFQNVPIYILRYIRFKLICIALIAACDKIQRQVFIRPGECSNIPGIAVKTVDGLREVN